MLFQKIIAGLALLSAAAATPIPASSLSPRGANDAVRIRDATSDAIILDRRDSTISSVFDVSNDHISSASDVGNGSVVTRDTMDLEERFAPLVGLEAADAGLGIATAIKDLVDQANMEDREARGDWTKGVIELVHHNYPGCNAFIYRRFEGGFTWGASNIIHQETLEFHKGLETLYYLVVVFKGIGQLNRLGDGGYHNWAFTGIWTSNLSKTVIEFKARV